MVNTFLKTSAEAETSSFFKGVVTKTLVNHNNGEQSE